MYLINFDLSTMTYSAEQIITGENTKDIKEFVLDGVAGVIGNTDIIIDLPD